MGEEYDCERHREAGRERETREERADGRAARELGCSLTPLLPLAGDSDASVVERLPVDRVDFRSESRSCSSASSAAARVRGAAQRWEGKCWPSMSCACGSGGVKIVTGAGRKLFATHSQEVKYLVSQKLY